MVSPHAGAPPGRSPRLRGPKLHAAPRPGERVFRGPLWGSNGEPVRTDVMETPLRHLALLLDQGMCVAWLPQPPPCPGVPILTSSPWGHRPGAIRAWNRLPWRDTSHTHLYLSPGQRPPASRSPSLPGSRCPTELCSLCSLGIAFPPQMGSRSQGPLGRHFGLSVRSLPHPTSSTPQMEKLAEVMLVKDWELPRGERSGAHPRPCGANGEPARLRLFSGLWREGGARRPCRPWGGVRRCPGVRAGHGRVTRRNEPAGLLWDPQDPHGGCGLRRARKAEGSSEENPAHPILFRRGPWLVSQTCEALPSLPDFVKLACVGTTLVPESGRAWGELRPSPRLPFWSRAGPLLPLLSHLLLPECGVLLSMCSPVGAPGGRGATEIAGPRLSPPLRLPWRLASSHACLLCLFWPERIPPGRVPSTRGSGPSLRPAWLRKRGPGMGVTRTQG